MDGPSSIAGLRGSPQRTAQPAVAAQEPGGPGKSERLEGIDVLRGLVMAVMVLDHTRDYFSHSLHSPTDLAQTSVALFFTRWVTHFCAPVFFLLAGTSAYLSGRRKSRPNLAWFLLSRGGFLVLLDLTFVRVGWDFNFQFSGGPLFVVLSALGFSMMALAGLIYLPRPWIAAVGASMVLLHNLMDDIDPAQLGALAPLWFFLHVRGPAEVAGVPFYVSYPLIPWVGVMALGYAIGPLFELERARRRRLLLLAGLSLVTAFVVLRAANVYGDPSPWKHDEYDLQLFYDQKDLDDIPTEEKNQIIVAEVNGHLHFRIFDPTGKRVVDVDETQLPKKAAQIDGLRERLKNMRTFEELGGREEAELVAKIRSIVGYTRHGAEQARTLLSFLNTTKYPPSLLYLLMTLGPALVLLAAFDTPPGPLGRALIPLGRTALFFYVLHLYLIHALAVALGVAQGYTAGSMAVFYTDLPEGYGVSLANVYLVWLLVLVLLYPPCLWYARLKKQSRSVWLSYL